MSCDDIRDRLLERIEDLLDANERAAFDAHLAGCDACRAEERDLRATLSLLAEDEVPDPGARYWNSFAGRVRTKIAARDLGTSRVPRGRFAWLSLAAGMAAIALAVFAVSKFESVAAPEDDPLLAMVIPADPSAISEAVNELSPEQATAFEEHLILEARAPKPAASPTPTPKPAASAKPAASPTPGRRDDASFTPRGLQDDLSDLDELSPEELDQLMEKLGAMKS